MNNMVSKRKMSPRTKSRLIFYICMTALPLLQYIFFVFFVNFNSILIAFQEYELGDNGYVTKFTFENFGWAINLFFHGWDMIKTSLIAAACNVFIVLGLAMFFSYYCAKKYFMSGLFRVMLYAPTLFSAVVFSILYKFLANDVYMEYTGESLGLFDQGLNTQLVVLLVFNVWIAFGSNVMIFVSTMSSIDVSMVESAQLDGATPFQEFIYIYVPTTYATLLTFVIAQLAGIFTNQLCMFTFYQGVGNDSGIMLRPETFGYYFFRKMLLADYCGVDVTYSKLAALGIWFSVILTSTILPLRKLLIKYGPKTD